MHQEFGARRAKSGFAPWLFAAALVACRAEHGAPKPALVESRTERRASGADAGTLVVRFVASDPHAHCRQDTCNDAPLVSVFHENETTPLVLSAGPCAVRCSDCAARVCRDVSCASKGVPLTLAELSFSGSYFEPGVCGAGTPCVTERKATAGKYVARLCAPTGTRSNDSYGPPVCVETGTPVCTSVPFEWPRTGTLTARF